MEKKTICIIHHATMQGGGSRSLIDLANMLNEQYRVIVCVPYSSSDMKSDIINQNLEIFEFKTKIPTLMSFSGGPPLISKSIVKTLLALRKAKAFCAEIESLKPDAVFYNSIVSIICAPYFNRRIKQFAIVRETLKNKITLRVYRHLLEQYFAGCCFIAGTEIKKLRLKKTPTLVVADSLPNVKREEYEDKSTQLNCRLLFLGGAQRIKGAEILLKALPFIKQKFTLTIAGGFPKADYRFTWYLRNITSLNYWVYLKRLNALLAQRKMEFDINYLGYCDDVTALIKESDILIFPSTYVHQPRPCIEAGYFGKAVILSDYEETKEYFIDGYNAVTFQPRNYQMLAEKIDMLVNDSEYRKMIGKNNQTMSFKYHSYEQIQKDFLNFMISKL